MTIEHIEFLSIILNGISKSRDDPEYVFFVITGTSNGKVSIHKIFVLSLTGKEFGLSKKYTFGVTPVKLLVVLDFLKQSRNQNSKEKISFFPSNILYIAINK